MRWIMQGAAALVFVGLGGVALAQEPDSVAAPSFQPGDTWVFNRTHEKGTNGFVAQRVDLNVERVSDDTMVVGIKTDGAPTGPQDHITGLDWSIRRIIDGKEKITGQPLRFPLKTGATWTVEYADSSRHGNQLSGSVRETYKVVGWRDVTTPAGAFHALKIESNGVRDARVLVPAAAVSGVVASPGGGSTAVAHTQRAEIGDMHLITYDEIYYVPAVRYAVKMLHEEYNANNIRVRRDTDELVSFKPAGSEASVQASR